MAELNLDKRRAEAGEEPHELTLDGVVYELPPDVSLEFANDLAPGRLRKAIEWLFGSDNIDTVFPLLRAQDLKLIANDLYNLSGDDDEDTMGKSSVSSEVLNRTGRRSKPTSKGSTNST